MLILVLCVMNSGFLNFRIRSNFKLFTLCTNSKTGKLPKIFDSFFIKTSDNHNVKTRFFISFSAIQIYGLSYIHLHCSSSTGILQTHNSCTSFCPPKELHAQPKVEKKFIPQKIVSKYKSGNKLLFHQLLNNLIIPLHKQEGKYPV